MTASESQARSDRSLPTAKRLRKLRAMGPAEISRRLFDKASDRIEREQYRRGQLARPGRLRDAVAPEIAGGSDWVKKLLEGRMHRARFFQGFDDRERMRRLFEIDYPTEWSTSKARAERVLRHEIEFFGRTFRFAEQIDWHADPVSGRKWPERYYADLRRLAQSLDVGDVKYVWELSRHQFLIDLGKVSFLAGSVEARAEIRRLVHGWMVTNPYARGINWASPLEPAFRSLSWMWAYYYCLADIARDSDAHLEWLTGFYDHARFIHRHLERYASPYNHLAGEAAVLYMLGVLFPEFREAARWRRQGRALLESRVADQFHEDGGGVEQATFYHHATLAFYLLAALLGRRNGEEFSSSVWSAIERAIEFSMYLTRPDGRIPAIGDSDDGLPIRVGHRPFWDFRSFQAIGAVLFGRADFKWMAGGFQEDALWLLGPEGRTRFVNLQAAPPPETSKALSSSGYFVLRSDWSQEGDYVCFDCGPQSAGARADDIPNAMHGHADCLAITAHLGGQPIFVDSGSYTYNGLGPWEDHFRRTAAHNTALVDGRDQSRHLGKMVWSHCPRARTDYWTVGAHGACVVGSHDGYARSAQGVRHRRTVWLRSGGYLLLYDEFTGGGEHQLELNFQLPPVATQSVGDGGLQMDGRFQLMWQGTSAIASCLNEGGTKPDEGWIAPSLGVRVAAPRLTLTSRFTAPRTSVLTVVADTERIAEVVRQTADGHPALALRIDGPGFTDWAVAAQSEPFAYGPFQTDAVLAVWRLRGDLVIGSSRVGGTYMRFEPGALESSAAFAR